MSDMPTPPLSLLHKHTLSLSVSDVSLSLLYVLPLVYWNVTLLKVRGLPVAELCVSRLDDFNAK